MKRKNKKYAGKMTKHRLEKMRKQNLILVAIMIVVLTFGVVREKIMATRTIMIINDEEVDSVDNSLEASPIVELQTEDVVLTLNDIPTVEVSIEEQIRQAFPEDPDTAVAIAKCESELDKTAVGDTHTAYCSVGIMQIRTLPKRMSYYGLTIEKLKDVETNLKMARLIKDRRGGWLAWSCYTSGKYKQHL